MSYACFNPAHPSAGEVLVLGLPDHRAVVTDLDGQLIDSFDFQAALDHPRLLGLTAITTGPDAGTFSAVDINSSELIVFRLR